MKLIDGLSLKGTPAEIPDCSRDDLPQFFVEMGYKVGAEIGIGQGEFSEKLCKASLKVFAIDSWQSYTDYGASQNYFDSEYNKAKRRLISYPNCKILKETSANAAVDFADNSLDFVYIDGNHQFKYIAADLVDWFKKVRLGGTICGHDYIYTKGSTQAGTVHVIYVVNAFTQAYKIDNWYLLGRKERRGNEVRDRFRSWMFVKQ